MWRLGGRVLGGAKGGGVWEGRRGGTSEQLGMRPRCDQAIRTAPCPNGGGVSSAQEGPKTKSGYLGHFRGNCLEHFLGKGL